MRFMRSRDFSEPSPTTEIVENRREKPHGSLEQFSMPIKGNKETP